MEASQVQARVRDELASYHYEVPPSDGLLGQPWSVERVELELTKLRAALVAPYLSHFNDCDTPGDYKRVRYWVVAVQESDIVFFDEGSDEFGLAVGSAREEPDTVNVRGDLASVFMSR